MARRSATCWAFRPAWGSCCPTTGPAAKGSTTRPRRCSSRRCTPRSISKRRARRSTTAARTRARAARSSRSKPAPAAKVGAFGRARSDPPSRRSRRRPKERGPILEQFLPRAFRRPAREGEVEQYLALFEARAQRGEPFEQALLFALQGVLVSPHFLFRLEEPNPDPRAAAGRALRDRLAAVVLPVGQHAGRGAASSWPRKAS